MLCCYIRQKEKKKKGPSVKNINTWLILHSKVSTFRFKAFDFCLVISFVNVNFPPHTHTISILKCAIQCVIKKI